MCLFNKDNKQDIAVEEKEIPVTSTLAAESCKAETTVKAEENVEKELASESIKPKERNPVIKFSRIGSDHSFANKNNQDYAVNLMNVKLVTDGCGSGNHSEVGVRLFAQLFARKLKALSDAHEVLNEENIIPIVEDIFKTMLAVCDDTNFIFQNYLFTILLCLETEDEFVVYSCGDGYIISEYNSGIISLGPLENGEYPAYYAYNFVKDKEVLCEYKEGVNFNVARYSKKDYFNIGVASDGLRFIDKLSDFERDSFFNFLREGKGPKIEMLINKNNRNGGKFHDDITVCF